MTRPPPVRRNLAVLWILAFALAASGCGRKGAEDSTGKNRGPSAGTLAQVDDAELREEDLRQLIPPDYRESITGSEIRAILDRWIAVQLLYQRAVADGLEQDPDVAETLQQTRRQILADEYLQRELQKRVRVTNEEIQEYYDDHVDEYTQEVQLRHILLNTPEEAEQILAELQAGGDFRALAQQHSTDPTASRGGDLGYLGKGAMNPAFEPDVFHMAPGEVRGPIASAFGFHIVQVVRRRRAPEPVTFDVARDEIMQILLLDKQRQAEQELFAELRASANVFLAKSYAGMALEPDMSVPETLTDPSGSDPDMPVEDTLGAQPVEP